MMTSVSKQHFCCGFHYLSGNMGKDFLIPMEKPTQSGSSSTLASRPRRLRPPERSGALGLSE